MADPGFPMGGGGGADLRHGGFSAKTHVKMKELDPVGGGGLHAGGIPWICQCIGYHSLHESTMECSLTVTRAGVAGWECECLITHY